MKKPNHISDTGCCMTCQRYYKISTLAEIFDMSAKTIRRRIADGKIKIVRIHGQIRIPHGEIVRSIIDIK